MGDFHSFSTTHKGTKHEKSIPCQDASVHFELENISVVAVADGHGSSKCFRSEIGAVKAIEAVRICLTSFIRGTDGIHGSILSQLAEMREDNYIEVCQEVKAMLSVLARKIIDKWFVSVMKDEESNPLQIDERLGKLDQKYRDRYINDVDYRCHAYGTTLMVVAVCNNFWFGLHIGDGKCVALYKDGTWRLPIPWDDKCEFNTTTSICDDDSLAGFRYWFGYKNKSGVCTECGFGVSGQGRDYVLKDASYPLAIFCGSDGVEDSYPRVNNDKYVINFYRNRIITAAEQGLDAFDKEIDGLALRFADRESTDDVSISGIICESICDEGFIDAFKEDSLRHERNELAAVKRRDADEKKEALHSVRERIRTTKDNINQLEKKISSVEKVANKLRLEKDNLQKMISDAENEVNKSKENIDDIQRRRQELIEQSSQLLEEQSKATEKREAICEELKKIKGMVARLENDFNAASKALDKAKDAYNKYLQRMTAVQSQKINVQVVSTAVDNIVNTVADTVDMLEGQCNRILQQGFTTVDSGKSDCSDGIAATVEPIDDSKLEKKKQEVEKRNTIFQELEDQVAKERRDAEGKQCEFERFRESLNDIKRRLDQTDAEITKLNQDCQTAKMQHQQQCTKLAQYQNNFAEKERQIERLQIELDKLRREHEGLKGQSQKQTATLNAIEVAWKEAESEAQVLELSVRE